MIGWLNGQIVDKQQPGKLVLDVNGVGYDVETSLNTFFQLEHTKSNIVLHIHTVVREDALLLYGFLDKDERSLFRALIKVNGIGPKSAIAILSSISPAEFVQCIQQENAALLTKLPGIGKKTAERLVIEMKDKIKNKGKAFFGSSASLGCGLVADAINALMNLGYHSVDAQKAVQKVLQERKDETDLGSFITAALQHINSGLYTQMT